MWQVLSFFCVVFPAAILALECGLPGMPVHGILKPNKLAYEDGEVVQISCVEGFVMMRNENSGKQTCVGGKWIGNRPTCLKNLAFNKSYFFGSNFITNYPGNNVRKMSNNSESMFVDFLLSASTNKAIFIFRGSLTARFVSNGSSVPLVQKVFAHDFKYFHFCPMEKDHFKCFPSDQFLFNSVKAEVTLKDQNFDLQKNPVEIVFQLENNGFIVADYSNMECGTPAEPLHGTVAITRDEAVYECDPDYQLKGLNTIVCDTSKEDGNFWPRGNPLCLEREKPEDTKEIDIAMMAGLIAAGCVVMVLLLIGMSCLYLRIERRNAERDANRYPMVPMIVHPGANAKNQGYNNSHPVFLVPPPPNNLMYPRPVQYPLIVSDLYRPQSDYSSTVGYSYDDVEIPHIYERME